MSNFWGALHFWHTLFFVWFVTKNTKLPNRSFTKQKRHDQNDKMWKFHLETQRFGLGVALHIHERHCGGAKAPAVSDSNTLLFPYRRSLKTITTTMAVNSQHISKYRGDWTWKAKTGSWYISQIHTLRGRKGAVENANQTQQKKQAFLVRKKTAKAK